MTGREVTAPEQRAAGRRRTEWHELPAPLRQWVHGVLGAEVVTAATQNGGFSPGAACRLVLADGSRAFLKAVSRTADDVAFGLHRRERGIALALPATAGAPRLIDGYDDGEWVALLMSDVAGRPPAIPWARPVLDRVLGELAGLHQLLTPSPAPSIESITVTHHDALQGWRRLAAAVDPAVDEWCRTHLDRLAELEAAWPQAAAGDTLLHADLRADNMLLTEDRVVFVDWAWACTGAAWVDVAAFAPSVAMDGGPDPQWLLDRTPSVRTADPDAVTAVIAAVAGYFTEQASRPAIPLLPHLRRFQAAQGRQARAWLRSRTGWR